MKQRATEAKGVDENNEEFNYLSIFKHVPRYAIAF